MSRQQVVDAYLRGDMSRRAFVRHMTRLGVSLGAALAYVDLLRPARAEAGPPLPDSLYDSHYVPFVTAAAATDIGPTGAVLHATVDPNLNTTTVKFEWGTGAAALDRSLDGPPQEGNGNRDVLAVLAGLSPGTTYVYRVVATNIRGRTDGASISFTTPRNPPQAETGAATAVTASSAVLNAVVDPLGQPTDVRFEWGTGPDALSGVLQAAQQAGDGDRPVSAALGGLGDGTTFAFRVVASNVSGEVRGSLLSMTTLDGTAPQVSFTVPDQTARNVVRKGLGVFAVATEDCTAVIEVIGVMPGRAGRDGKSVVVARATARLLKSRRVKLQLSRTRAGVATLKRSGVRYELRHEATDAVGNKSTGTTKLVLR